MPIYEYACNKCENKFELLRHFYDTTQINCPKCGAVETERTVSSFSCGGGNYGVSGCAPRVSS